MRRSILISIASIFMLFSIVNLQPQGVAVYSPITDHGSSTTHHAPPFNDTLPTLVPPPILIPRTPSLAPGSKSVIVIAVEFSNQLHTKTVQEVEQLVFTDVNRYYQEASYGKVSLTGRVAGWYNMNRTVGAYGRDGLSVDDPDANGSPDSWQLIQDAVDAADKDVDFTQYSYLMVFHAGFGQETSQNSNDIWSCAYIWGIWFKTKDGPAFSHATIVPELEDRGAVSMGVITHEFGHELGLPDLYDPYGQKDYLGKFDLMSRGIYNGNPAASSPSHPVSWGKIQLGWIESNQIRIIEKGGRENVTLNPLERTGSVLVLKVPIADKQYFLVEVRERIGFDLGLPATGVLITYVDENISGGGSVKVVDANPLTMSTDDSPFQVGQVFSDSDNNIAISVLSTSNQNYQIYVDRGTPQPDLAISFSGMDPQRARKGQQIAFTFLLRNLGTLVARDFRVRTLIDGNAIASEAHTLEAGSILVIQYVWGATLGVHTVEIRVDPDNVLSEFNRVNNQVTHQFVVGSILSVRLPWTNGSLKVNGTTYAANASDIVEIPILPGQQTIELPGSKLISPGKRLTFVRWIDGDTSNPRKYNATDDATLVPVYKTEFRLSVDSNQGATKGDGWFDEGATASAEVTSPTTISGGKTRLTFLRWTGDADSNKTIINLKMDRPRNITAVWNREHYLTIVSTFSSTEKQGWYKEGEKVSISATSTVDHGNGTRRIFLNWSGNLSSNKPQIEVTMSAPQQIISNYFTEYEVVVASDHGSAGGRRWISSGESCTVSVQREIVEGETRHIFQRWEGDLQSDSNEAKFTVNAPKSVKAIWKTQHRATFTITGVPNGTTVGVKINGEEHQGSAPYSYSEWFDSGAKLDFDTPVTVETVTYEYSLEGWKNSVGESAKPPYTLNGPTTLRTVYVSRPKGLLNYFISAFGTDKLPEIVLLRSVRDSVLIKTFGGRHLIYYFDFACHAVAPNLASQVSGNSALRTVFSVVSYPLMKSLAVPASLFELGLAMNEFTFLMSSFLGAALIGMIYLSPIFLILGYALRRKSPHLITKLLKRAAMILLVGIQIVIFGEIISSSAIAAAAIFSVLVVSSVCTGLLFTWGLMRMFELRRHGTAKAPGWSAKSLLEEWKFSTSVR